MTPITSTQPDAPLPDFDNASRPLVSREQFFEFQREYYKLRRRGHQHERFGQAFYNKFDDSGMPFPKLFYCTDEELAKALIFHHYLRG